MPVISTNIHLKEFQMSDFILVSIMVLGIVGANLPFVI